MLLFGLGVAQLSLSTLGREVDEDAKGRRGMVDVVVFTATALAVSGTLALGAGTCLATVLGVALDMEHFLRAFDM